MHQDALDYVRHAVVLSPPSLEGPAVADSATRDRCRPYSSGTTGKPKGVMLSHLSVTSNISQILHLPESDLRHGDMVMGVLPLFHIYGMVITFGLSFCSQVMTIRMQRV